jgi:hypothetical protein
MALDPACAGKVYPPLRIRVRAESIHRFARAMHEDNPLFTDAQRRGGILAPPMYAALLAVPAVRRVLTDPALGAVPGSIVPLDCDFRFTRPIRPTREIVLTTTLEGVDRVEEGEVAVVRVEGARRRETDLFEGRLRFLHPEAGRTASQPEPASEFIRPALAFRTPAQVRDGAPFFTDTAAEPEAVAHASSRLFLSHALGLAYAAKAIRDCSFKRDPYQLKRIAARLVRPLRAGELVHTAGWIRETRRGTTFLEFEVLAEDGGVIVAEGKAEIVLR